MTTAAHNGSPSRYAHGCRCDLCTEAWRVYRPGYNRRLARAVAEATTELRRRHQDEYDELLLAARRRRPTPQETAR